MVLTDSVIELSRLQFAVTALYHFLFVPLTLGLSFLMAIMESVYVMTGIPVYKEMTKFWGKLFGINYALGVTTGLPLEFQFGSNWAYYAHYVGDVFGPLLAVAGTLAAAALARQFVPGAAFWCSGIALAATLLTVGFALFPFLVPSSLDPGSSLTVWDAAASPFTLKLVLAFTLVFLPLVIAYTGWVYRVLWGQINTATLEKEG